MPESEPVASEEVAEEVADDVPPAEVADSAPVDTDQQTDTLKDADS
jgi:hypothetical protein